jgi:ADP-heptose:LPS heptosyltransferase/glycosyltransferase involved in cell wall biosynthesis
MVEKRRVLYSSEAHFLLTGFSKMSKETLKRLAATNKYELAEFASYGDSRDPRAQNLPWKFYGNLPINQQEAQIYQSNYNENQFGLWKFEYIMEDFKPDFYIDTRDWWMQPAAIKGLTTLNKCTPIYEICVDSEPIPFQYREIFKKFKYHVAYSEYAKHIFKRDANIDVIDIISPGVDTKVHIPRDKIQIKKELRLPEDVHIIQMSARNQPRKRFDRVFESYQIFKKKFPDLARKTILHFHCYKNDVGFNFSELLKREGGLGDVLFTYACQKCGFWFIDFCLDEPTKCKRCGEKTAITANTNIGINEEDYSKIFNIATVQVQGTIADSWNLCIGEAKANKVPVIATDFAALSEQVRPGTGGLPIKVQTFYIEDKTLFKRAWFDRDDLVDKLGMVIRWAEEKDPRYEKLCNEARAFAEKYDWDIQTKKWENLLDTIPIKDRNTTWFAPIKPMPTNVGAVPSSLNDSEFVLWLYKNVLENDIMVKTSGNPTQDTGYNDWMRDLANGRTRQDIENYFRQVAFQHNVKAGVVKQKNITEILDPTDTFRIIFSLPKTAGDIIVSTAVIDSLRKKYPHASIYFATSPQYFDLVSDNPNIKAVLPYSDQILDFRQIEGIFENKPIFDISFTPFIGTQKICSFIHGGHGCNFAKFYANYCDVELGDLFVGRENFPLGIKGDYIVMHSTTNQPPKDYDRFDELMPYLNLPVVQVGGPHDKEIKGTTLDLRGKLNWKQTADVVANSKAAICVDAAIGHLAATFNIPSFVIYGGTFPSIAAPLRNTYSIEPEHRFGCLKSCHLSKCPRPSKCINNVEPEQIARKIKEVMPDLVKEVKKEEIIIRGKFNMDEYIGIAPIFVCNYQCPWCVSNMNREIFAKYQLLPPEKWIEIINKLAKENPGIPASLGTAGELSLYKGWERLINETNDEVYFRILTNLSWNVKEILPTLKKNKILEIVPSFHPTECNNFNEFVNKCKFIMENGIYLNLGMVYYPENEKEVDEYVEKFKQQGIRLRKEVFLGWIDNELYPKGAELERSNLGIQYHELMRMVGKRNKETVRCKQQKLIVSPDGLLYNCHHAFYNNLKEYTLKDYKIPKGFKTCDDFGFCNICDSSSALIKK